MIGFTFTYMHNTICFYCTLLKKKASVCESLNLICNIFL